MRGRVLPSALKAQVDTPELLDLLSESSGFLLATSKLLFHSRSLIVVREQIRENGRATPEPRSSRVTNVVRLSLCAGGTSVAAGNIYSVALGSPAARGDLTGERFTLRLDQRAARTRGSPP
jgi:hypothetical protein